MTEESEREEDSAGFSYRPRRLCAAVIRHTRMHPDASYTDAVTQKEGGDEELEGKAVEGDEAKGSKNKNSRRAL